MSPAKRRTRRPRAASAVPPGEHVESIVARQETSPQWNWRTMPVFFAFGLGGFVGVELGTIAGYSENDTLWLAGSSVFAIILGFAMSRVVSRFMVSHNWVKPRPRRRR